MIDYYTIDALNIYVAQVEVDPYASLPRGTIIEPPGTVGTEVARWLGNKWEILDTYPETPAPYVRPSEEVIAEKIEQLWQAADKYSTGYISGVAIGILTIGVIQSKPKAIAVTAWSNGLWSEYYARKALITADSVLDLDFSGVGAMPYSVPELQEEIGL